MAASFSFLKVRSLNIDLKSLDIDLRYEKNSRAGHVFNYWSESSLLPYKTSLEPEKHEKQGSELRYRLYLDDLG